MKINDFFDKIYCINLPERKDRWEQCEAEFKKHNIEVQKFDAQRGTPINKVDPGNVGLIMTNIKILQDAKINGYKSILILEDDAMFIEKFNEKFEAKIDSLHDDWHTIHLGGNHHFHMGPFNCISKELGFVLDRNNYKQIDHEICTTSWSQTTHAVGINNIFYDKLLEQFRMFRGPIDMIYCSMQRTNQYKMYAFIPSLALQRPSFSDIQNYYVDYNNRLHFF